MNHYSPETLCIHAGYTPKNGEPRIMPIVSQQLINMKMQTRLLRYSI